MLFLASKLKIYRPMKSFLQVERGLEAGFLHFFGRENGLRAEFFHADGTDWECETGHKSKEIKAVPS